MSEMTAREELYEVAKALAEADEQYKTGEAEKKKIRPAFFDLITEVVEEEVPLSEKTIKVSVNDACALDPDAWLARDYPSWKIVKIENDNKGGFAATIRENPALTKFEFVVDGFKFGRTVDSGSPDFNAEKFYFDHQDPALQALIKTETTYTLDEVKAAAMMADKPELKDVFEKYIKRPTPKPKLLPIRPVKEEE